MDSLTARVIIRMVRAMAEEGIAPWFDADYQSGPRTWEEPMVADVLRQAYEAGGHYFDGYYLQEAGLVDEDGTPTPVNSPPLL